MSRLRAALVPVLSLAWVLAGASSAALAQSARSRPGTEGDLPSSMLPLEEESEHVVVPGETLGGVAHRAKVPRVLIIEANHLKPPYVLHTGQKLALPRTRHHVVKAGETGFDIAYRYGVSYASIAVANGLEPNARLHEGQKLLIPTVVKSPATGDASGKTAARAADKTSDKSGDKSADNGSGSDQPATAVTPDDRPRFLWPLEGRMRRGFVAKTRDMGGGDFHNGLDIVAKEGTTVRTSAPGEVIFAGREPDSFGNLVVVEHSKGWQTAYGFLSKLTVKRGDTVKAHERVGLVGHSGRATRDELHFEIRRNEKPVDPQPLLPPRAGGIAGKKDAAPEKKGASRAEASPAPTKPGRDDSLPKAKSAKAKAPRQN